MKFKKVFLGSVSTLLLATPLVAASCSKVKTNDIDTNTQKSENKIINKNNNDSNENINQKKEKDELILEKNNLLKVFATWKKIGDKIISNELMKSETGEIKLLNSMNSVLFDTRIKLETISKYIENILYSTKENISKKWFQNSLFFIKNSLKQINGDFVGFKDEYGTDIFNELQDKIENNEQNIIQKNEKDELMNITNKFINVWNQKKEIIKEKIEKGESRISSPIIENYADLEIEIKFLKYFPEALYSIKYNIEKEWFKQQYQFIETIIENFDNIFLKEIINFY